MTNKTKTQLEEEIRCKEIRDADRVVSDLRYSFKWIEKGFIWLMTIIGAALVAAWLRLILK